MLDAIFERMRMKASEDVDFYCTSTGKDVEYLFCLAYIAYYGASDIEKIRAGIRAYEQTEDPPPYVRWFLGRKVS